MYCEFTTDVVTHVKASTYNGSFKIINEVRICTLEQRKSKKSPPDGSIWIDLSQSKYLSTNLNTFILKVHNRGNVKFIWYK